MIQPSIILVEADVLVRTPLAEYIRECGYQVLEASNPAEARQLLAGTAVKIDIVLADIDSPGENGFALAGWIRNNHPGVEVVLAGSVVKATEKAGDICEDGPAVSKPYDHQLVLDRIRRQLAARRRNNSTD